MAARYWTLNEESESKQKLWWYDYMERNQHAQQGTMVRNKIQEI